MDAIVHWKLAAAALSLALITASIAIAAPIGAAPNEIVSNRAAPRGTVQQATYQATADVARGSAASEESNPPMPIGPAGRAFDDASSAHGEHRDAPASLSSGPAVLSIFGSLAVVVGLFLGLVWLVRRGSPKAARLLSSEVVALLGRSPLAGRQQMHVIRFGNRLLLVAVSPDGAETLAEVSDPAEVDRLAGLCQQTQAHSATQAFRQIFGQFADLRRPGQLDSAASATTIASAGAGTSAPMRNAEDDDV